MAEETSTPTPLSLYLLGTSRLVYGRQTLTQSLARKELALLIYLTCQPEQRFSREHLATLLWSEVPQSRARYNLRRALWSLRRSLEEADFDPDDCLTIEGSWIYVPPHTACWVDVRDFEEVLQACFQDLQTRFSPTSESIRRIRKALDLYRGDFLAGFSVPNAPNFDEWVTFERERLFLLLLRALTSLIQSFIARGERDEAIAACQRLLVLDPLQEDIHRLLMRLYWETGQRAQALRQYRTYRELLQDELGIEPLEETQELYRRILQQETSPVTTASSLVLTSRITPPAPTPESLARPRLFSLLDRGLDVRLTLLSAPPGYGKTTLMAQWLSDRSDWFSTHPGTLVGWYKVGDADNVPSTFVEGLTAAVAQLYPPVGQALQDQVQSLITLQGDHHAAVVLLIKTLASLAPASFILVLDDTEHLTSSDSQRILEYLVEHLPINGHLYLLSRVDPDLPLPRLRVRGQLMELGAAELRFTDEEMTAFLKRAHGLSLSPAEVAELTTRAEGWIAPLWLAANALSRFASTLDDVWQGLFAYLRDEVLAPQPPAIRSFLLRSALLDRFGPSLCQAILPSAADNSTTWLSELEQRNLFLRRVPSPIIPPPIPETGISTEPQYVYHPLFLAFLRSELPHHLSPAEIQELHHRAATVWEQQGNLEQALFHYQQIDDELGIARLLERIAPTYLEQGRLEPLARWLDQLEPAVRDQHPRLTLNAGRLRQAEGRIQEAYLLYRRAASGFETKQDSLSQGDSLLAMAELELRRGHYFEGLQLGQQVMACWDETEPRRCTAALCTIAQLTAYHGELPAATITLGQARELLTVHRDPLLTFQTLRTQAWIAYLQGNYHRAVSLNHLAEREIGQDLSPETGLVFRNPIPAILREWGEGDIAWDITQHRLEAAHQFQDHLALSQTYVDLGKLHLDYGEFDEAERAFHQAIAEAEAASENGFHRLRGQVYLVYAHALQGHAGLAWDAAHHTAPHMFMPLVAALVQMGLALAEAARDGFCPSPKHLPRLYDVHQAFNQMGIQYATFASAVLLGLAHLGLASDSSTEQTRAEHHRRAYHYVTRALTLAAAEGYVQTLVTSRRATLPLLLFALREGVEPRFTSLVLSRMGPDPLPAIIEMLQAPEASIRQRAAASLKMVGDQEETRQTAMTALDAIANDPNPNVRAAATYSLNHLHRFDHPQT